MHACLHRINSNNNVTEGATRGYSFRYTTSTTCVVVLQRKKSPLELPRRPLSHTHAAHNEADNDGSVSVWGEIWGA